jgi:hypothetical protein
VNIETGLILADVYFHSNPWEGSGEGRFTYLLSFEPESPPERVRVAIFTVSGRTVARLEGGVENGRNWIRWNMRDSEGGELANGVYLFKLNVEGTSGDRIHVGRLVVHR